MAGSNPVSPTKFMKECMIGVDVKHKCIGRAVEYVLFEKEKVRMCAKHWDWWNLPGLISWDYVTDDSRILSIWKECRGRRSL